MYKVLFTIIVLLIGAVGLISIALFAIYHRRNATITDIAVRLVVTAIGVLFIIVVIEKCFR
jgi:uncharacterized alpha/beta hydrolase family protein